MTGRDQDSRSGAALALLAAVPDVENLLRRCDGYLTWGEVEPPWGDADVLHAKMCARAIIQAREILAEVPA